MSRYTHLQCYNILNYREYKIENNEYILRLEIEPQYINFKLIKINESLEYYYKNKIDYPNYIEKI